MLNTANEIKIWPQVILAAIRNKRGGAARLWFVAKSLDPHGSGKVSQDALLHYLADLKVGARKRQRWMRDALDLGLIRKVVYSNGEVAYKMVSWGRGAGRLGCDQIGNPAIIPALDLVTNGWRALVWGAYVTTLEGRILSQETKYQLTGVDPRTQRNYQLQLGIESRQNYSNTELKEPGESSGKHLFFNKKNKKVVQRLPNIYTVSTEVARSNRKGRSRKAQREVNSRTLGDNLSYPAAGLNERVVRLFHETKNGAERALEKLDSFGEAFWCKHTWQNANQWGVLVQL